MRKPHTSVLVLHRSIALLLAVGSFLAAPTWTSAQIRASERGSVSQTVDGTTVTVDYSRPQVRGRSGVFGGEVPWGKVWTPGANWATTIEVSKGITISGREMPQGKYSVWFEVQPESWTAIFDPVPRRFHLMPPPASEGQVRFTVTPKTAPHQELLTWSFHAIRPTGAELVFAWADKSVSFDIGVEPSLPVTVSPDVAERYVGDYRLQHQGPLGNAEVQFDVVYENNRLVATWEGAPNPNLLEIWLVSLGAGMFAPAELKNGELFDIVMDLIFEFDPADGRADGFELRALGDALWGSAHRVANE
jgi:hypothetical protein